MRPATLVLCAAALTFTSCSRSSNNASAKQGGGNGPSSQNSKPSPATNSVNGNARGAAVPDPHASNNPHVGREAGVGDDPSELESADPKENGGDSGRPGPAQKP